MAKGFVKMLFKCCNSIASICGTKAHLQFRYFCAFKRLIDWKNPKDLNQLICQNMVTGNHDNWTVLADKYAVRDYLIELGLSDLLVPLYRIYNDPKDINLKDLPDKCVLKANNGSGDVVIVTDKSKVDIDDLRNHFYDIQAHPYGKQTAERHYLKMPFKIVVEELLDHTNQDIESSSLIDYKMWFVDGQFKGVWIAVDRANGQLKQQWRDKDWNLRLDYLKNTHHHRITDVKIPKPLNFNKMVECGKMLGKGQKVARIDFYVVGNKIYFGEITLSSAGGLMNYFSSKALKELIEKD